MWSEIQGDSRVVDLTAGDDSLGICEKRDPNNMGPLVNVYGSVSVFTCKLHVPRM
jgi:hypothetical protein